MVNSEIATPSLPESYRTVAVPHLGHWIRRLLAFCGPGYLIAVGYMDPGNWATDLSGGSHFGYSLLWVILLSNLMALVLQFLSARLGIATGRDLAQACREHYSRASALIQWLLCELAICAADVAEVIGTAIALKLLFGISLLGGIALTSLDTLVIMGIHRRNFRYLEALITILIIVVFFCLAMNIKLAQPDWLEVAKGFIPSKALFSDQQMLYIAIGILGATVMPHNLYLHSSLVQTRQYEQDFAGKKWAIRFATVDVTLALTLALVVNASILITAATVFHRSGHTNVIEIESAYHLLAPLLGSSWSSILFGIALLASGQSSAITATLAGQVIMEGFTRIRAAPWIRRLLTRSIALLPALGVVIFWGDEGVTKLLILSQVILGIQLPFAIGPLIRFTSDPIKMGPFTSPIWLTILAYCVMVTILLLNIKLLVDLGLTL